MSYATLAQLLIQPGERVLIQLTDRDDPPTGAIVEAVVDRELANTDAVIDGYLAGRYVLPLAETPPLLADLAKAIVVYKLHNYAPDPKVEQDYKDAIGSLKLIAQGTIRLPVAGIEPESSGASGVVATDRERDMTPENMRGFI